MKIIKYSLVLLILQFCAYAGFAQTGCNFMKGDSISFTVVGAATGANQQYVLTNAGGIIQFASTTLPIADVPVGQYLAYTVVYDNSGSAPDFSAGQDINNLSGSACHSISETPLTIGVCDCSNSTGSLSFQLSGEDTDANTTQVYVLTDGKHKIVSTHNSSPITGLDAGIYNVFSVVYDNTQTAPNFTAGIAIGDIGGSCSSISTPLGYVVCVFDLALTKRVVEPAELKVEDGEEITFAIKVYNQGNIDAFDVKIKDYAGENMSFTTAQNSSANTGNSSNWANDTTYTIGAIAAGDSAEVIVKLNVNVTDAIDPETFLNKAEVVFASETLGGPLAVDDDSTFDTDGDNDIIGGDNKLANEENDEDDHDYAWVNYNGLFDPRGFIYCDKTGAIVQGGSITVETPPGGIAYIIDDGSSGEFFFFTNNVAGVYTVTYTHPSGFTLSNNCLPQAGAFDPTGTDGTGIDMDGVVNGEVSLGVDTMGAYITDTDCTQNPYYLSFDLAPGDPFVVDNHLPVSCVYISAFATLDQNGDNVRDVGDLAIENATVNLFSCSDTINAIATTKTDNQGAYRFDGIPAGDYRMQFIAPAGTNYSFATADVGTDEYVDSDVLDPNGFSACKTLDWMECDTTVSAIFKLNCLDTVYQFCEGESFTLSTEAGVSNVKWFKDNAEISGATDTFYIITEEGSFHYEGVDTNGCTGAVCCPVSFAFLPKSDLATTDTTICNEVTIDLNNRVTDNANLAGTMTWHSSAADANTGASPLTSSITPITTTRYYVRKVTNAHSCVDIDSTLITVQDAPNLSTTDQTICAGISVNLATLVTDNAGTSGTVTYHNSLADAHSGSSNLGSNLTPAVTTKYYIRKNTTTGSCVDIDSLIITIQPLPDLATTDATICQGTSIDLDNQVVDNNSTTGSQSYFLSMADADAGANIQSNPVSPTTTTTYYVKKITTVESCTDIASLTITVQPLPNLTTRDTTLCNGQSVDLVNQTTDEAGTTGTMTYHATLTDAQSEANVLGITTVNPSADAKYYVRKVTTTVSCMDIDSIAITIQALPDLVPTDSTICNGISVDLNGLVVDNNNTIGNLSYHNTLADAQGNSGALGSTTVNPSSTTKYYLRKATTTANCVDLDSLIITVQPNPDLATTDATICAGVSIDLSVQVTDNATTTGTTTFHNTLADAQSNTNALGNSTVSPSATTKYYVLKTTTTTNCTDLDSLTITVQPVSNLSTKDTLACAGDHITLDGLVTDDAATTGTTTFHTTLADAQAGSNALGSSTVNAATTTKYYVRKVTTIANCPDVDSLTITRQPLPDLTTLDSIICATNAVDLIGLVTDNAGTTGTVTFHTSNGDAQLGVNELGSSNVSPASTTTYHVRKETATGGCFTVANLEITVQPNPDLVTTDATICNGVSIDLSGQVSDNASTTGTMTYHSSLAEAQSQSNPLGSTTVMPNTTTKYYIQKTTTTANCQDLDSLTITVQPLPDLLTSDVFICAGETVDLIGRVSDNNGTIGTTTFHNSLADAQSASNALGNSMVTPSLTTKYYVSKVTTTASCAAVDSITINVQALPDLTTENDTLCVGQNVDLATLVTDAAGTTGTMSYHPTLADAQGNSNPLGSTTVSPTATTEYYIRKETTMGNCVDLDSLTIVMESVPSLSTTDIDLCAGESVDLATLATDNAGLTGTMTYHASLVDAQNGASPLGSTDVTPVGTTKYYVRKAVGTQNCQALDSLTVTVNPLPANATNPTNGQYCDGDSPLPTISVDDPGAGFTVTWWNSAINGSLVSGATISGVNNQAITLSGASSPAAPVVGDTTTVYAQVENTVSGCISANRIGVSLINNIPTIISYISPAVCAGDMTTLGATISQGTAPYSYNWRVIGSIITPFGGSNSSTDENPVFDASSVAPGTYQIELTVTDINSCFDRDTFDFNVQVGVDGLVASSERTVCAESVDEVFSISNFGAGTAYSWNVTNGVISGGGTATDTFVLVDWTLGGVAGEVGVTITLTSGCQGQNTTQVTIAPKPDIMATLNSPICAGDTLKLSATTTSGTATFNYDWSGTNAFTANVEDPIIADATIAATGNYQVIVTDANACKDTATVAAVIEQIPNLITRDTTVCPNESVDLSSLFVDDNNTTGTTTYYNTLADAEGMTNAISSTVTTAIADKYYLRKIITNVPNCTVIDSIEVTIQPNPALSTIDALICDGATVDLSTLVTDNANTTGTLTYHSSLVDAQSGVGDIGNSQSPTTTTKYYVLKTTATVACTNIDSLTITVQDLPVLATLDSTICGNETVDLTGLVTDNAGTTGTTTFHTSLADANNSSGAISNSVMPVISTKYYVRKETTVGTCVTIDSMTITLQTVPNLSTRDTLVCDGQSVELTTLFTDEANTTGTTTFHTSKSNAEGNIAALGSTLVTPNFTSKYYIRKGTNLGNCVDIDSIVVNLQTLPDLTATNTLICVGASVDLSTLVTDNANTIGTLSYHNNLTDAQNGDNAISATQSPTVNTEYFILKTTTDAECIDVASVMVNVQVAPDLVTKDSTICAEQAIDLGPLVTDNASTTGTTTFHTTHPDALAGTNAITNTVTPSSTTKYYVRKITTGSNCSTTDSLTITLQTNPNLVTRDSLICASESVELSNLVSDAANTIGTTSFYDNLADAQSASNALVSTNVTLSSTTKYFVRKATTTATCTDLDSLTITIQDLPDLATTPPIICAGENVDLNTLVTDNTPTSGILTYHATFADAEGGTNDIGNSQTPTSDTKYYILKTTTAGDCTDIDSVAVTVQPFPDLTPRDTTICGAETVDLSTLFTDDAGTVGTTTFHNLLVDANNGTNALSTNVTPITTTKFYIRKVTTTASCPIVDSLTVNIVTMADLVTRDSSICAGESADLATLFTDNAGTTGTMAYYATLADANGGTNAISNTVNPVNTTKYYLSKSVGSQSCLSIDSLTITILPLPDLVTTTTTVCPNESVDLSTLVTDNAGTLGTTTYHNSLADATSSSNNIGANQNPSTTTKYYIRKITTNNCLRYDSVVVNIQSLPDLTVLPGSICAGGSIDLKTVVTDNAGTTGTLTCHSTLAGALNGTAVIVSTVSPSMDTKFYFRKVTTTANCVAVDSVTVSILPDANIIGRDTTICAGFPVDLKSLLSGTVSGSIKYGTSFGTYSDTISTIATANGTQTYFIENEIGGGCVDTTTITVTAVSCDLGDLPDTSTTTDNSDYQTLQENNGPVHVIIPGLSLGATVDTEPNGQPLNDALGDGEDEDGLTIFSTLDLKPGITFRLPLSVTNTTTDTAHVEAWIDWNGDGDFDDANEMVADLKDATDGNFPSLLSITVPANATTGLIGLRIRISNTDNMTPYGFASTGEIEDYLIGIQCPSIICIPATMEIQKDR